MGGDFFFFSSQIFGLEKKKKRCAMHLWKPRDEILPKATSFVECVSPWIGENHIYHSHPKCKGLFYLNIESKTILMFRNKRGIGKQANGGGLYGTSAERFLHSSWRAYIFWRIYEIGRWYCCSAGCWMLCIRGPTACLLALAVQACLNYVPFLKAGVCLNYCFRAHPACVFDRYASGTRRHV